jgi:hypothetical protein
MENEKHETSLALIVGDVDGKLTVLDSYDTTTEAVKVARKLHRSLNSKRAIAKPDWSYTRVLVIPTLEIR